MLEYVSIKSERVDNKWACPMKIAVNHVPIRAKRIDYHAAVDEIPYVVFEVDSFIDLDVVADAKLHFIPEDITDANAILRHELLSKGDYYNGFISSVESALMDCGLNTNVHELAENIVTRIIGD